MLLSIVFLTLVPIILAYVGAFIEYLTDKNIDIGAWYRTPTRMTVMMITIILSLISITYGIFSLADYYHIIIK